MIDENINNRPRAQNAPVRHSAADTNGASTQACRHSAVRYRRRKAPRSETPTDVVLSCSAFRPVDGMTSGFAHDFNSKVSASGTPPPRVDTARLQMAQLNGYRSTDRCQNSSIDVTSADGDVVLARTSETAIKRVPETDEFIRTSDGSTDENSNRTLSDGLSNGATCVSNLLDGETSPVTAVNGVPVFDYSNSDSDVKDSSEARKRKFLRLRSAIRHRAPTTSVEETPLDGFPAIVYPNGKTSTTSDARNETKIVPRSEYDGALAKAGDFDREREIERRMRELGLWEYKREQEKQLTELLDAQISQRDGLTAALRRCRRRQRGRASATEDIRSHVNHHFIRYTAPFSYRVPLLLVPLLLVRIRGVHGNGKWEFLFPCDSRGNGSSFGLLIGIGMGMGIIF